MSLYSEIGNSLIGYQKAQQQSLINQQQQSLINSQLQNEAQKRQQQQMAQDEAMAGLNAIAGTAIQNRGQSLTAPDQPSAHPGAASPTPVPDNAPLDTTPIPPMAAPGMQLSAPATMQANARMQPAQQTQSNQPVSQDQIDRHVNQALNLLSTPLGQRISQDPGVQNAQQALNKYVNSLGDITSPEQLTQKQLFTINAYTQLVNQASGQAAKNIGVNDKAIGQVMQDYTRASVAVIAANARLESMKINQQTRESVAQTNAAAKANRPSSSDEGVASLPKYDELTKEQQDYIKKRVTFMNTNGGAEPPSGSRSKQFARLNGLADALFNQQGDNPQGKALATQAEIKSNRKALDGIQQKISTFQSRYDGAKSNFDVVKDIYSKYKLSNLVPLNQVVNYLRGKLSSDQLAQLNFAISAATKEYAGVISGNSGQGGSSVAAQTEAKSLIRPDMTFSNLIAIDDTMHKDSENIIRAFEKQRDALIKNISEKGQYNGPKKKQESKGTVSQSQLAEWAKAKGVTPEEGKSILENAGYSVQ